MKNKILTIAITAILSLTLGYFLFSNSSINTTDAASNHVSEDEVWTCSMHPQIRRPEPGDCPICGMDLILADAGNNDNPLVFEMTEDAMRIANIQTTIVGGSSRRGNELFISGKIETDETVASTIVTHIPGRIEKMYISFTGDHVSKGQKIASIYSPDLITAQRELLEAYKLKDDNPELLEATKNKLRYWKITNKEINEIIKSGKQREYFDIRADHAGVIEQKNVSVGDYLNKGSVLFELQNLNQLWAVFDVYEADLKQVSLGKEITFKTPSLPNDEFTGAISFINPFINGATRTASIRLKVNNINHSLKPEMFINGSLELTDEVNASVSLTVPKTAVLWTGKRSVVYVKLKEVKVPSFEYREVQIGESIGDAYEILDGLMEGDEIVTNGAFVIDASAQLNNQASMMNRNLLSDEGGDIDSPDFSNNVDPIFKKQLIIAMDSYLNIKDALVKSDSKNANLQAKKMQNQVTNIDMKLVTGPSHLFWMSEQEIVVKALKIIEVNSSINEQRQVFDELSSSIIKVAQAFGLYDQNYKVQFCPMANNDKGAYWLSKESQIRNPYFGDQMLTCGEVKDSIRERNKRTVNPAPMQGHNH